MSKQSWYIEKGPQSDVVVSSRVRLARNLKGIPFAPYLDDDASKSVLAKVKDAAKGLELSYLSMEQMPPIKRQMLVERHVISPEMLNAPQRRAVLLSADESASILLGEEDHLRIQCYASGLDLEKAYAQADKLDKELSKNLEFGFSEKYGYTTCCPTNVGTGLRASCMLHLPMLADSGYLESIFNAVGKLGMTVRGLYGEGSGVKGDLYQVSNQITLGVSETESIAKLTDVVKTIVEKERSLRKQALETNRLRLEDKLWRSLGVLACARAISGSEAMELLSDVRLGSALDIIPLATETIQELMIDTGAAHIADGCGSDGADASKRDAVRAELIRGRVQNVIQ